MSRNFLLSLKDKVVIITGASAGIGEAVALEFARQGSNLVLCGRDENRLNQVKKKCMDEAIDLIKIETVSGNIVERDVQKRIVGDTYKAFGKIDVLVNNAGVTLIRNPSNTEQEAYKYMMNTNMESVFFLTQLAIPYLIKTQGTVINMSSIASNKGIAQYAVYAMSKAALDSYTKSLALFLAPHKVRVNSVNPASVESLLYRRGKEAMSDEQYAKFKRDQASSDLHPLGRMVKPSEVADAVTFLASDRASFMTGQILFVDGGRNIVNAKPRL